MFGEFFPEKVESLLIESDIFDHVIKICVYDFNDLFNVVSTLTTVLNFQFDLLVVAFTDFLQYINQQVPVIKHCS
jgi:hypothetical protein